MKEGGMFTDMRLIIRWDGKANLADTFSELNPGA